MTFQPPPSPPPPPPGPPPGPPAGGPPQGPPPSQWGPPPGSSGGSSGSFDPKSVNQLDWGILGAGVLAFIFSFVSYYTVDVRGFGSGSESAWNGFFGWFAMLLALVGSAAVALDLFMPHVKLPFPNRLIGLGAYAVATLSVLLALLVNPIDDGGIPGVDTGHGFGYWVSLIVIVAGLVLSFLRFQQTGGQLPAGRRPGGSLPPGPPR